MKCVLNLFNKYGTFIYPLCRVHMYIYKMIAYGRYLYLFLKLEQTHIIVRIITWCSDGFLRSNVQRRKHHSTVKYRTQCLFIRSISLWSVALYHTQQLRRIHTIHSFYQRPILNISNKHCIILETLKNMNNGLDRPACSLKAEILSEHAYNQINCTCMLAQTHQQKSDRSVLKF